MNYCSIEDAWKNTDFISDQFKIYENPYEKKNIIENFESNDFQKVNYEAPTLEVPKHVCTFTCDNFWEHLNTCQACRMKIRQRFSSKIVENIQNIILDNKDNVLLVLIIMFILIFFNLLISIFRK
tara:strand:+ start:49 stop:423 length:375 start_codon:yes stop_codon:yes gene_type:complete